MSTLWYLFQVVLLSAAVVYGVPYLVELWRNEK